MGVLLFDVEGIKIAMPCAGGSYVIAFVSLLNQKNQVWRKSLFQGSLMLIIRFQLAGIIA